MSDIQYDKVNAVYKEKETLETAKDEGVITQDEYDGRAIELKNELRELLGFEPV